MISATRICYAAILGCLAILFLSGPATGQNSRADRFYRGTPINPLIQTMVDSISADSLQSYLQTLVGFHTRHINSDTTSPDTGIGAARNYVLHKFEEFSAASGGVLTADFFVFSATVCGTHNDFHKNVLATIPGNYAPQRHFIVSGHLDSRNMNLCDNVGLAPGADDDGTGVIASMEIARVLSQHAADIENTLIMMAVTGEEQGLIGSGAYADWAVAHNMRIDGMITNDIIGSIVGCENPACPNGNFITDSTSVRHFSAGPATSPSRQFARYMKLKGEQYVTDVNWTVNLIPALDRPGRGGDHIPFSDNGYASARFTEAHEFGDGSGANGHQHNQSDSIQFVNFPYTARVVKCNLAGLASLAMAPETPQGQLTIQNVGNGTELFLSWTNTNSEPDFAGYRIALRHPDSLFYQQIVPAGNVTQFTLTGLTPDQPVFISYSAIDNDGNESIFSQEVLATPSDIPAAPRNFEATSTSSGIQLNWLPNTEFDLAGYRINRTTATGGNAQFTVDANSSSFFDDTAQPHVLYHYTIQAEDNDNNLSQPSDSRRGQLATHDMGIFIVDVTRDGSGGTPVFPTDEQVDSYYSSLLTNFNLAGQWDVADSLAQNKRISDADIGVYSTIVVHSDVRLPTNFIAEDTVVYKKYLQNGGRIFLGGWQLINSTSGDAAPIKVFSPGSFVYEYLQLDSVENAVTNDFRGADAVDPNYISVLVDSAKIPNFGGDLISMEAFRRVRSDAEVLFTYRSSSQPPSPFHGKPVALRHITATYGVIAVDFPLFYMEEPAAQQIIQQALMELGEVTGIEEDGELPQTTVRFNLKQNYPNPFNPLTRIEYHVPKTSQVNLTIFNLLGQEVVTLVSEQQKAGTHQVQWDGRDERGVAVTSGIYLYRLKAGDFREVRKMMLVR